MKIKKTWFSYVLWGIFSIILFASVGVSAVGISRKGSILEYLPSIGMFYAVFVLGVAAYIGISVLFNKFIKDKMEASNIHGLRLIEIFALVFFMIAAIAVRVLTIIINFDSFLGTDKYFNLAAGVESSVTLASLTNGEVFYIGILKFMFGFLGSKPFAAMVLQMIFQMISLLLLYPMMKRAMGIVAAWAALLLYSFLPGSFIGIAHVTPDCMISCMVLGFLFLLSLINQLIKEHKIISPLQAGFYILLGAIGGLITYFDIIGIALILIAVFSFFSIQSDEKDLAIHKPFIQTIVFAVSYLIALAIGIYFMSGILRAGIGAFQFFAKQFLPENGISFTLLNPHFGRYDALALYVFAGIWFIAFLRTNLDKGFPYVCLIVFTTAYIFLGCKTGDYSAISSLAWILLSAVGFTSVAAFGGDEELVQMTPVKKPVTKKKSNMIKEPVPAREPIKFAKASEQIKASEMQNAPEEPKSVEAEKVPETPKPVEAQKVPEAPKPVEAQKVPEVPKPVEAQKVPEAPKPFVVQKVPEAPKPFVAQKVSEAPKPVETPKTPEAPKKMPRMLKNPLPEPKPHVPKEMNYDYFPKPSEMHYDITDMRGKEYYDI